MIKYGINILFFSPVKTQQHHSFALHMRVFPRACG